MSRALEYIARPIRVPYLAMVLLAFSALAGNLAQWDEKGDLQRQGNVNNAEAECRARIEGYVDGLSITQDIALGTGLLDRLGPNDDDVFQEAVEAYASAVRELEQAKGYQEDSVKICASDASFDPAAIPKP